MRNSLKQNRESRIKKSKWEDDPDGGRAGQDRNGNSSKRKSLLAIWMQFLLGENKKQRKSKKRCRRRMTRISLARQRAKRCTSTQEVVTSYTNKQRTSDKLNMEEKRQTQNAQNDDNVEASGTTQTISLFHIETTKKTERTATTTTTEAVPITSQPKMGSLSSSPSITTVEQSEGCACVHPSSNKSGISPMQRSESAAAERQNELLHDDNLCCPHQRRVRDLERKLHEALQELRRSEADRRKLTKTLLEMSIAKDPTNMAFLKKDEVITHPVSLPMAVKIKRGCSRSGQRTRSTASCCSTDEYRNSVDDDGKEYPFFPQLKNNQSTLISTVDSEDTTHPLGFQSDHTLVSVEGGERNNAVDKESDSRYHLSSFNDDKNHSHSHYDHYDEATISNHRLLKTPTTQTSTEADMRILEGKGGGGGGEFEEGGMEEGQDDLRSSHLCTLSVPAAVVAKRSEDRQKEKLLASGVIACREGNISNRQFCRVNEAVCESSSGFIHRNDSMMSTIGVTSSDPTFDDSKQGQNLLINDIGTDSRDNSVCTSAISSTVDRLSQKELVTAIIRMNVVSSTYPSYGKCHTKHHNNGINMQNDALSGRVDAPCGEDHMRTAGDGEGKHLYNGRYNESAVTTNSIRAEGQKEIGDGIKDCQFLKG